MAGLIDLERTGRILGICGQSVDDHAAGKTRARLLDRHFEIDELAGSGGGIVRSGDGDAIDEDHAQVAVLGATRGGDVGLPAGRERLLDGAVGDLEVELQTDLGAVLDEGFCVGLRRQQRADHRQRYYAHQALCSHEFLRCHGQSTAWHFQLPHAQSPKT